MSLAIITADQRLADANSKTTMAIFGPSGVGKTSLLKTLPPETTLCVDLEAGMKSVQEHVTAATWQRPMAAHGAVASQPAKPAGPAWLNS